MRRGTCHDLGTDQNLATTDTPSVFFFSEFQGEGVERNDSSSGLGSRGIAYILKGRSQDTFSHRELFW